MQIHNAAVTGSFTYNGIDISDITGSEQSVVSLNEFSASILNYTSSNNQSVATLQGATASLQGATSSLFNYTASNSANVANLFATSASLNAAVADIRNATSSLYFATASIYGATSSLFNYSASSNLRIGSLEQYTASLNTRSASFACVDATNTFACAQYFSNTSNAISFSSTGSLYSDGGMRLTKDLYVSGTSYFNNVTVFGTQSINYITSSQLNIASNLITVNTSTPAVRFGGLAVYDSGSLGTGLTGSLLWDSENNHWVYSNPSGSSYSGGMFISGPRSAALGSEQGTTACALMMGQGGDHITSSAIFHYGNATCFYGNSRIDSSGNSCQAGTICATNATFNGCVNIFTGNQIRLYNSAKNNWTQIESPLVSGDAAVDLRITTQTGIVYINQTGVTCFNNAICAPRAELTSDASCVPLRLINGVITGGSTTGVTALYLGDAGSGVSMLQREKYAANQANLVLYSEYGYNIQSINACMGYNGVAFYTAGTKRLNIDGSGITCFSSVVCASAFQTPGCIAVASTSWIGFNGFDRTHAIGYDATVDGVYVRGQNGLRFITGAVGGTERMRLDASGNLGLGVTPSAWTGTNVKAFQFGNSGALANSGTFGTIVFNNSYYDGGYKYITSNNASAYVLDGSTHLWYQAPSGTAGCTISFTQAMTLNACGRLILGNTTDNTYSRLQVAGGAWIGQNAGRGLYFADGASYTSIVGLNQAVNTYNAVELRASGVDGQLFLATSGNVGVGTTSVPSDHILQVHSSCAYARMALTNTSTGVASGDGLIFQMENNFAIIKNQETSCLVLGTNGRETDIVIGTNGGVGIGQSPINKFTILAGNSNVLDLFDTGAGFGIGMQAMNSAATVYRSWDFYASKYQFFSGQAIFSCTVCTPTLRASRVISNSTQLFDSDFSLNAGVTRSVVLCGGIYTMGDFHLMVYGNAGTGMSTIRLSTAGYFANSNLLQFCELQRYTFGSMTISSVSNNGTSISFNIGNCSVSNNGTGFWRMISLNGDAENNCIKVFVL